MTTKSLSSLDSTEQQNYLGFAATYLTPEVNAFIEKNLVSIATHYVENTNSSQKRGFIRLNAVQPDQLDDDPKYDLARDGEQDVWRFSFIAFDDECVPKNSSFFTDLKLPDPYQMPIVFIDSRHEVSYEGNRYKSDPTVAIGIVVPLSPYTDEVAKETVERSVKQSTPRQQPEQKLEDQLYDWLRIKGIDVERQVITNKHRLDLWIPNKAMLELKQGRVSGDDVCQAIDYAATYKLPIILVGTGLSSAASRGIDGFNRAMSKDLIIFVTWGGVKPYLSGVLKLK